MAELNFQAQENQPMSPDSVCNISAGPAGHKTKPQYHCHDIVAYHCQDKNILLLSCLRKIKTVCFLLCTSTCIARKVHKKILRNFSTTVVGTAIESAETSHWDETKCMHFSPYF